MHRVSFSATTALLVALLGLSGPTVFILAQEAPPAAAALEDQPFYNPLEDLEYFDIVMKPYELPVKTTTYVNFVFNLPENLPELFHVVHGEVLNSQPLHLHHFVLTGCTTPVDPSREGLPREDDIDKSVDETVESVDRDCILPLGGWAPGASVFGVSNDQTGILMGRGMGMEAIRLNVHYTDGAYEDAATLQKKLATDGIRIYYVPNSFRPYTSTPKRLINLTIGPKGLTIPPGESRFFVSRTCEVDTKCKDATPENLQQMVSFLGRQQQQQQQQTNVQKMIETMVGGDLSCSAIQPFCNAGSNSLLGGTPLGRRIKRLCPETCGMCDNERFSPEAYRITAINYHAHLLGREMYTTLLREEDTIGSTSLAAAAASGQATSIVARDMESRDFWIFDNQEVIPVRSVEDNGTALAASEEPPPGTLVRPGDKIQVTCVYDSSYQQEATRYGRSTYDEMCITTVYVTFPTPASLLNGSDGIIDLNTELGLQSFDCASDPETGAYNLYTGTLEASEDGRNIWRDHPIAEAKECTFSPALFGPLGMRAQFCPETKAETTPDGAGLGLLEGDEPAMVSGAAASERWGGPMLVVLGSISIAALSAVAW